MESLYWLPTIPDWSDRLKQLAGQEKLTFDELAQLARANIDFLKTDRLDRAASKLQAEQYHGNEVRLAVLSSCTVDHLMPAIRVGGLRRELAIRTYLPPYGAYQQELLDPGSELYAFQPNVVLLSLDSRHLLGALDPDSSFEQADNAVASTLKRLRENWALIKERTGATIIQQTVLPVMQPLVGSNEHLLAGSRQRLTSVFNERLCALAGQEGTVVLALHDRVLQDGLASWHDVALWHRSKQEIRPTAAPLYGDLVGRLIAASQGRSSKCLVLDLDNTLWSGVIGDDGLDGIVLGQGNAVGEAHLEFQAYARNLSRRGVILAVCSKNDEDNARQPFDSHPEMLLRNGDIACFIANWDDKATNIRRIAGELKIGLDAMVFVDDNAFEREIVRRELPRVSVPELPEEPASWPQCLADAGYFEVVWLTSEDRERTKLYKANAERQELRTSVTDVEAYLMTLEMKLQWRPFHAPDMQRVVQLINKTNQFNLMTRRYAQGEVELLMRQPRMITLQTRLSDVFGDNGLVGVIIGRPSEDREDTLAVDTWLMSCRVLGRRVEDASLNVLADRARELGYRRIIGLYRKTGKNGMVADLYSRLGFSELRSADEGVYMYELNLAGFRPKDVPMKVEEVG